MNGVILDLDQTLVDSSHVASLRRSRKWPEVYQVIPSILPYDGINEILSDLTGEGIRLAIVTSSPRPYCERVIKHNGWSIRAAKNKDLAARILDTNGCLLSEYPPASKTQRSFFC